MQHVMTCTPKELPPHLRFEAAAKAIEINPQNRVDMPASAGKAMNITPDHLALLAAKKWSPQGVRLTVQFWDTPADLAQRLLTHFNAWGAFCNVAFVLSNVDAQVRVTRAGQGYWSYLGTDILMIPKNEPTMCLQGFTMSTPESECRRVVRHEVGHTLGFAHEHLRAEIVARINRRKALAFFARTQGWPAAVVESNVLTPLDETKLQATPHADEISLMAYQLPGEIMNDGRPVIGGSDFSAADRQLAAAVYPNNEPDPPPVDSSDQVGAINIDFRSKVFSVSLPAGWKLKRQTQ